MSIMEKAKELGQEIVESSEYRQLKDAEQEIYDDEEAKEIMDDFQAKQKQLQMAQANGQNINQQQQKKIQALQAKMQSNPKIKKFIEAQNSFNEVMKTVNQTISNQLQGEE